LLMNSEVWVCLTEEERCLPFVLVERDYDVWVSDEKFLREVTVRPHSSCVTAGKQSRKQILKEEHDPIPQLTQILGFLNVRTRSLSI
jgi:hypothetical protein